MDKKLITEISRMKMIMGLPNETHNSFILEQEIPLESIEEELKNLVKLFSKQPDITEVERTLAKVVEEPIPGSSRKVLTMGRGGEEIKNVVPAEFNTIKQKVARNQIDWDVKPDGVDGLVRDVKSLVNILKYDSTYVNKYFDDFVDHLTTELTNQSLTQLGEYHQFTKSEVLEFIKAYKNSKNLKDVKSTLLNLTDRDLFFSDLMESKMASELKTEAKNLIEKDFSPVVIVVNEKTTSELKNIDLKQFGGQIVTKDNKEYLIELNKRCNNYPDLRKEVAKVIYKNFSEDEKKALSVFEEKIVSSVKQNDLTIEEAEEIINKFVDEKQINTPNFPSFNSELKKYILFEVKTQLKLVPESKENLSTVFQNLGTKFFTNEIQSSELSKVEKVLLEKYIPSTLIRVEILTFKYGKVFQKKTLENWGVFLDGIYSDLKGYIESSAGSGMQNEKLFTSIDARLVSYKINEQQVASDLKNLIIQSLKEAEDVNGKKIPENILTKITEQLNAKKLEDFQKAPFWKVVWRESIMAKALKGITDKNLNFWTDKLPNLVSRSTLKLFTGNIWKLEEYQEYTVKYGKQQGLLMVWGILSLITKVVIPAVWGTITGALYALILGGEKMYLDWFSSEEAYNEFVAKYPYDILKPLQLKLKTEFSQITHTWLYDAGILNGPLGSKIDNAIALINPFSFPVYYFNKFVRTGKIESLNHEALLQSYREGLEVENSVGQRAGVTQQSFDDSVRTGDLTRLTTNSDNTETSVEDFKSKVPCWYKNGGTLKLLNNNVIEWTGAKDLDTKEDWGTLYIKKYTDDKYYDCDKDGKWIKFSTKEIVPQPKSGTEWRC
jgi:hypothetical protein